ncbi:MAG: AbrB/MazE/SpoVT family DNA-binding domain-containing protein, partial [Kiritimatiellae bacterium]|nr:AbrB/MazE/SpoVT family DNA-binding domain-containing protein [Kiritimatiellia bacterium]
QITIPKQFRTQLGFRPGMVFAFSVKGNSLFMTAQKPEMSMQDRRRKALEEMRGCLKGAFDGISTDDLIAEMRGR